MYAVTVLFKLKEGRQAEFLPLMIDNAQRSLRDEPDAAGSTSAAIRNAPAKSFFTRSTMMQRRFSATCNPRISRVSTAWLRT